MPPVKRTAAAADTLSSSTFGAFEHRTRLLLSLRRFVCCGKAGCTRQVERKACERTIQPTPSAPAATAH